MVREPRCQDHQSVARRRSAAAPFPRQLPAAALIDELARRLDLVIIVAAGNSHPGDYLSAIGEASFAAYPVELLSDTRTGIIDPGTAALALTVGGITTAEAATGYSSRETVLRRPLGEPGWPSPVTRRGPGIGGAVKPELVDQAGTLGIETGRLVDNDPELGVISAKLGSGRVTTQLVSGPTTLGSQAPTGVHSLMRRSMARQPCLAPV